MAGFGFEITKLVPGISIFFRKLWWSLFSRP